MRSAHRRCGRHVRIVRPRSERRDERDQHDAGVLRAARPDDAVRSRAQLAARGSVLVRRRPRSTRGRRGRTCRSPMALSSRSRSTHTITPSCSSTISQSTSTRSTSCSKTARRETATSASTTADTSSAVRAVRAVAEDPGWAGAWAGWSVVIPQYGLGRLRRRKDAGEITTLTMVRQAFVGFVLLLALATGMFLFVTLSSHTVTEHGCGDRHGRGGGSGHGGVPPDRAPSELRDRGHARRLVPTAVLPPDGQPELRRPLDVRRGRVQRRVVDIRIRGGVRVDRLHGAVPSVKAVAREDEALAERGCRWSLLRALQMRTPGAG